MFALGRALMSSPKVLMLDEPSLGLARLILREIFQIIAELEQSGASILLIEQNARAALQVVDYGYVIENGGAGGYRLGVGEQTSRCGKLSRFGPCRVSQLFARVSRRMVSPDASEKSAPLFCWCCVSTKYNEETKNMKMNFRIGCAMPTALARIGASNAWADITLGTTLTATSRNASIGIPGKNMLEGHPTAIAGQNV